MILLFSSLQPPSSNELLLSSILMHRVATNDLLFDAGGIVDLGSTVLVTVSGHRQRLRRKAVQ